MEPWVKLGLGLGLILQVVAVAPDQSSARLIREKTSQVDLDLEESRPLPVFYQTPQPSPLEGLPPPQRPNFRPIYSDSPAVRPNDKLASLSYGRPSGSPTLQPTQFPSERHSPSQGHPSPTRTHQGDHPSHQGLKTGYFPPATRVMPRVSHIEAECRDDFMKLRVAFNDTFAGMIYSAGYTHDNDCMYINGTGQDAYEFYIQLNRCGTLGGSDHSKREVKNTKPTKNYMWNTVTIQYNPLIEEEWDEHFKVTCEYGYDFWKTVTFPFLEVDRSGLEV